MGELKPFLDLVSAVDWLSHAGEPSREGRVAYGMQSAWDGEGKQMLDLWGQQTHELEALASTSLGENGIDRIFEEVAAAVSDSLYRGLCSYLDRIHHGLDTRARAFDDGVFAEVIESIRRDLCWAGVEHVLGRSGFFTALFDIYRKGRWPCSWDGSYPDGRPVVL